MLDSFLQGVAFAGGVSVVALVVSLLLPRARRAEETERLLRLHVITQTHRTALEERKQRGLGQLTDADRDQLAEACRRYVDGFVD